MNTSFPNFSIIFLSFLFASALVGVPPLKYIQKYNNIFFQSLQGSLAAQSPKCKIILSFAGPWIFFWSFRIVFVVSVFRFGCFACFGGFISLVSLVSVVSFRWFLRTNHSLAIHRFVDSIVSPSKRKLAPEVLSKRKEEKNPCVESA